MPPKKNQINGFWLFAQKNKSKWKAQGLRVGTNNELLSVANPLWKHLDPAQRKEWDKQAKEARRNVDGAEIRYDNVGNIIGTRQNPAEEARKRRERDIVSVTSKWAGKDLTQERLYFINFQELCELTHSDNTVDRKFLPRELAMVEYSLKDGIIQSYHQFVWPGDIPLGFRYHAEQMSEEFHKIPASKMDLDSDDYPRIWQKMLQVVRAGVKDGVCPPLYCLTQDYDKMKYLTDWMWVNGGDMGEENPLHWICSTEDLVVAMLAASGRPGTQNLARSMITARLDGSQWEYIPATTCDFHRQKDVSRHCALAVVRRTAYTISDMVGMHFDITLSERHVPVRQEDDDGCVARVLPPGAVPLYNSNNNNRSTRRGGARGGGRGWNKRDEGESAGSYRKMARPEPEADRFGMPRGGLEEEEYVGQFLDQPRRMQPAGNLLKSSQSVMMQYHGDSAGFPQPKQGQFEDSDWPSLGGVTAGRDNGPAVQMSNMTLADEARETTLAYTSPPGFSGVGRGAAWGIQAEPSGPAFNTQQAPPTRGRGMAPQSGGGAFIPRGPTPIGRGDRPPLGRGNAPSVSRGSMPSVGRGEMVAAGRGMSAPSVGRGNSPSVGRGEMTAIGRGNTPPSVGRGEMPSADRGNTPPSVGRGEMPAAGRGTPAPSVGRGGPPVGRGQLPGDRRTAAPPVGRGQMPASGSDGATAAGRGWSGAGNFSDSGRDAASCPGPPSPVPGACAVPQQPWAATGGSLSAAAWSDDFPALGQAAGRGWNPGSEAGRGRGFLPAAAGYNPS